MDALFYERPVDEVEIRCFVSRFGFNCHDAPMKSRTARSARSATRYFRGASAHQADALLITRRRIVRDSTPSLDRAPLLSAASPRGPSQPLPRRRGDP